MPITTSASRVKSAGYWCDDADEQTQTMLNAVGADWNTEIPIEAGLDHLGLSNTLLALGAVRPKYELQAGLVLLKYTRALIRRIKDAVEKKSIVHTDVNLDMLSFHNPDRAQLKIKRSQYWMRLKYNEVDPELCLLYGAMVTILSDQPLHIRAIYASRDYLSARKMTDDSPDALNELKDILRKLLNAAV